MKKNERRYDDLSRTGWPKKLRRSISTSIGLFHKNYKYIYVGITDRPWERWGEHIREDQYDWERCILLYKTISDKNVNMFEGFFINDERTVNIYPGWSHMKEGAVHYLYILLAKRRKKYNETNANIE